MAVPGKKTKQKERRRKVGRSAVRSGCWPASKKLPSELAGLGPGIHTWTFGISAPRFLFQVICHFLKLWLYYLCEIHLLRITCITVLLSSVTRITRIIELPSIVRQL